MSHRIICLSNLRKIYSHRSGDNNIIIDKRILCEHEDAKLIIVISSFGIFNIYDKKISIL